ncbi:MAG: hypothetical protein IMW97_01145 [Firmicutes bacterium]|nr:hypothetical protein [Candidatus Fermentithermobacillaceae bacterium]
MIRRRLPLLPGQPQGQGLVPVQILDHPEHQLLVHVPFCQPSVRQTVPFRSKECATVQVYLPSPKRERYVFTTEAYAPYDVLIAGSDRQDGTIGVIFRVAFDPDPRKSVEIKEYRFPSKGPIACQSLEEDNQVVTFRWGTDGKGYFDLRNGTATFEEYRPER